MSPDAVGALLRLQHAATDDDALALVAEAVQRGADPLEAHLAWMQWNELHDAAVTTIYSGDLS